MPGYYDDLSDCSSRDDGSESEEEGQKDEPRVSGPTQCEAQRRVLYVDVDCFYCQCEAIDRKLSDDRPFAIGQKHIIVTCNYAARRRGVKKLELREKAYSKCPELVIFEGSDLTRYRIHSRAIYDAFRRACKQLCPQLPVAKGCMDEMMADLGLVCNRPDTAKLVNETVDLNDVYIYGERGQEQTFLTEDQTGDSVVVMEDRDHTRRNHRYDVVTAAQLQHAASLAVQIRASILRDTGFRVTVGVSSNRLLAKLASGLKKPGIVNLLYPWRSNRLLEHLPLRKLDGAGRRTLQVLHPCLTRRFPGRKTPVVWTCRDLRAIPDHEIAACLRQLPSRESSEDQARRLLLKCTGIDETPVEDDTGGLPKTVSVENSFRRGTVTTQQTVMDAVNDVCRRLPELLRERINISNQPSLAYPSTLRLTVRLVIEPSQKDLKGTQRGRRRPFETSSRQSTFPGKKLLETEDSEKPKCLFQHMSAMLRTLVLDKPAFDVTRLNLAVTNFNDLDAVSGASTSTARRHQTVLCQSPSVAMSSQTQQTVLSQTFVMPPERTNKKRALATPRKRSSTPNEACLQASDINPAVLEELPPDIRAQIRQRFQTATRNPRKKSRIDDFFQLKKK